MKTHLIKVANNVHYQNIVTLTKLDYIKKLYRISKTYKILMRFNQKNHY